MSWAQIQTKHGLILNNEKMGEYSLRWFCFVQPNCHKSKSHDYTYFSS